MNAQPGRPEAHPTKGYLQLEDMIRLQKVKNDLLIDPVRFRKYSENLKDKVHNRKPRHDMRIRTHRQLYVADDPYKPLSFSGITNPVKEITYFDKPASKKKAKMLFVENFENPYYEA